MKTLAQKTYKMDEKTKIIKKIQANPNLTLAEIAAEFGVSYRTMFRRMKKHNIQHGRKQGRRIGTEKPLK